MIIRGKLYDGKTSAALEVTVELTNDGTARVTGSRSSGELYGESVSLQEMKVSSRIGDTPRRVTFANGTALETNYNDELDDWLHAQGSRRSGHHVFRMERHWLVAIAALILTLTGGALFMRYGIPAAAKFAARTTPLEIDAKLGSESLVALDKTMFQPSQLTADRQTALRARFDAMTAGVDRNHTYRLEFRRGWRIGANAFALPSGIVVVTDELVALVDDPRELDAVLAHEIGHVVNRHALRTVLQTSASGTLLVAILGDFTSVSNLIAAAPVILIKANYSRELESEADEFAYDWMKANGLSPQYFTAMLTKLENAHEAKYGSGSRGSRSALDFFSSHPRTQERIRHE